ncbi:MAG: PDZ domain-containing protein, partial [Planctomycetota bacterium]
GVVESVVEQIVQRGEVRRGFLGITSARGRGQSTDVLDREGGFVGRGILVASVEDGLAADRAGIEPGDIITRIDDNEIREWHHLSSVISTARPGSRIEVELWRDGEPVSTEVHLAEFPDSTLQRSALFPALLRAGMQIGESRTSGFAPVVAVEGIFERGDAARAGFRRRRDRQRQRRRGDG